MNDDQFKKIADYVALHPNFIALTNEQKLVFYGLYKASFEPAPHRNVAWRLYAFIFDRVEYLKWAAWDAMSVSRDSRGRYCELSIHYQCFPSQSDLARMNGNATSRLISETVEREEIDDLLDACRADDVNGVMKWDVNTLVDGTPVLHFAVDYQAENVVRYLLTHGASINAVDEGGQSALHVAAINGREWLPIARLLIDGGIDAEILDNEGHSARDIMRENGMD